MAKTQSLAYLVCLIELRNRTYRNYEVAGLYFAEVVIILFVEKYRILGSNKLENTLLFNKIPQTKVSINPFFVSLGH